MMGYYKGDNRLEKLEEVLTKLYNGDRSPITYYELILLGHRVYKQGIGLPHQAIYRVIEEVTGEKFPDDLRLD